MAIGGNEANAAGPTRARRRNSGSMKRQRGAGNPTPLHLVDYRQKQADLSTHTSLLPVEVSPNATRTSKKLRKPPHQTLVKEVTCKMNGSLGSLGSLFGLGSLSSSSHNDMPSTRRQQVAKDDPNAELNNSSEHSIQLEKVFDDKGTAPTSGQDRDNTTNTKEQIITFAHLSVTRSKKDEEKIKFLVRNPDIVRAVQLALEDTRITAAARQRRRRTQRVIKCHIPHDRFKLPKQIKMVQTQRDSMHASTSNLQPRPSLEGRSLHAIDEANESQSASIMSSSSRRSKNSFLASRTSMLSSCGSFASFGSDEDEEGRKEQEDDDDEATSFAGSFASSAVETSVAESTAVESPVAESSKTVVADTVAAVTLSIKEDDESEAETAYAESETEGAYAESEAETAYAESGTEGAYEESETEGAYEESETEPAYDNGDAEKSHAELSISILDLDEDDSSDEETDDEGEESESYTENASIASGYLAREDPIADSDTEGEESIMTSCTEGSSNNGLKYGGLSVYLSSHSRQPMGNPKKKLNDSYTATSVTDDVTSISHSNQSDLFSVRTSSTNRTSRTNRTSNSAPGLLSSRGGGNDSLSSMKSELDESAHGSISSSRGSFRMTELSRASSAPFEQSRSSSAPFDGSRRSATSGGNLGNLHNPYLLRSSSSIYGDSDADDSTVGSAVDHRRRRPARRSSRVGGVPLERGEEESAPAIIPRSNTPQGLKRRGSIARNKSGDLVEKRALRADAQPMLPPRSTSRGSSLEDGSIANGSTDKTSTKGGRRGGVGRSRSMAMESSSATSRSNTRRGIARAKSGQRESFMGGSKIKRWDDSAANKSGQGLSLLERHLNESSAKAKQRPKRRPTAVQQASTHQSVASMSVASLQRMLTNEKKS